MKETPVTYIVRTFGAIVAVIPLMAIMSLIGAGMGFCSGFVSVIGFIKDGDIDL